MPELDPMYDIVGVLTAQHRRVEELFVRALADGGVIVDMLGELLHALALHESADHVVIHPEVRRVAGEDDLVDALMAEELAIERALTDLDAVEVDDDAFAGQLVRVRDLVVEHNWREESVEFPVLSDLDSDEQRRILRAVGALEKLADTGSESEGERADVAAGSPNTMVGPFAAVLDRATSFKGLA